MNGTWRGKILRGIRLCALVLILSSALLPVFTGGILTRFGTAQISIVTLWAGALVGGLYVACGGEIRIPPKGLLVGGVLFLIAVGAGMWRAEHKLGGLLTGVQWVSQVVMLFALVALAWEEDLQRLLLAMVGATVFAAAVHAIHQYYFGLPLVRRLVESDPEAYRQIPESLGLALQRRAVLTRRAFGTFITPNSLGALMLVGLPLSACCLWGALKRRMRRAGILACAIITLATAVALVLSKSKGAWVAGLISAGAVGMWTLRARRKRAKLWFSLALCGVLVVLVAAALTGRAGLPTVRQFGSSFLVRVDYWRGAWALIRESVFGGHGVDSFGSLYPGVKLARAHETLAAHNDFLQMWAEVGFLGLAGFVVMWAAAFAGLRREGRGFGGTRFPIVPSLLVLAGLAAGCAAEGRAELLVFVGALWLPATYALWKAKPARGIAGVGLAAAMLGYLIHSTVDMNAYIPGGAQPAWLVAGIAVLAGGNGKITRAEGIARKGWTAFGLAVAVVGAAFIWRLELESLLAARRIEAAEKHRAAAGPGQEEKVRASYEAMYELEKAAEMLGIHDGVQGKLGGVYAFLYGAGEEFIGESRTFDLAVEAYGKAAELNPSTPVYYAALGGFLGVAARAIPGRWKEAVRLWSEAVARYPTNPRYRLNLAQALRETGERERAALEYAKALELDREVQNEWLLLSDGERREAEGAMGEAASR